MVSESFRVPFATTCYSKKVDSPELLLALRPAGTQRNRNISMRREAPPGENGAPQCLGGVPEKPSGDPIIFNWGAPPINRPIMPDPINWVTQ